MKALIWSVNHIRASLQNLRCIIFSRLSLLTIHEASSINSYLWTSLHVFAVVCQFRNSPDARGEKKSLPVDLLAYRIILYFAPASRILYNFVTTLPKLSMRQKSLNVISDQSIGLDNSTSTVFNTHSKTDPGNVGLVAEQISISCQIRIRLESA